MLRDTQARITVGSDGSREVAKPDGNQKMTQTMNAFGPASRTIGNATCMQNLALSLAGNFNPGLTARMPDPAAL